VAIFGATGAVKSTLFRSVIAWDISAGADVTMLDPHGHSSNESFTLFPPALFSSKSGIKFEKTIRKRRIVSSGTAALA
jgi:DNA helicase HerA-like ATPase